MSGAYKLADALSSHHKAMLGFQLKNNLGPLINMDSSDDQVWNSMIQYLLEMLINRKDLDYIAADLVSIGFIPEDTKAASLDCIYRTIMSVVNTPAEPVIAKIPTKTESQGNQALIFDDDDYSEDDDVATAAAAPAAAPVSPRRGSDVSRRGGGDDVEDDRRRGYREREKEREWDRRGERGADRRRGRSRSRSRDRERGDIGVSLAKATAQGSRRDTERGSRGVVAGRDSKPDLSTGSGRLRSASGLCHASTKLAPPSSKKGSILDRLGGKSAGEEARKSTVIVTSLQQHREEVNSAVAPEPGQPQVVTKIVYVQDPALVALAAKAKHGVASSPAATVTKFSLWPDCKFGAFCTRGGCHFKHPAKSSAKPTEPVDPEFTPCKFGEKCNKENCEFQHGKSKQPCRFGMACKNIAKGCEYGHALGSTGTASFSKRGGRGGHAPAKNLRWFNTDPTSESVATLSATLPTTP